MAELLLPPTKEFTFIGTLDEAVEVRHMLDDDGQVMPDTCELTFHVRRNPTVFLFRSVATTIIVSFGSMICALLMHIEDNAGNRETVLFVAFLIALSNMQMTDIGLGKINELLWIDVFNLVQLALVTAAIMETVIVHYLFVTARQALSLHLDNVCHFTLPALYCGVTLGLFLMVDDNYVAGIVIIAVFSFVLIPVTIFLVWLRSTAFSRRRKRRVYELQHLTHDDGDKYDHAVRQVFESFDVDGSGELDMDECRELMKYMKPSMKRHEMLKAMEYMRRYADSSTGALTEADFSDALFDLVVNGSYSYNASSLSSGQGGSDDTPRRGRKSTAQVAKSEQHSADSTTRPQANAKGQACDYAPLSSRRPPTADASAPASGGSSRARPTELRKTGSAHDLGSLRDLFQGLTKAQH